MQPISDTRDDYIAAVRKIYSSRTLDILRIKNRDLFMDPAFLRELLPAEFLESEFARQDVAQFFSVTRAISEWIGYKPARAFFNLCYPMWLYSRQNAQFRAYFEDILAIYYKQEFHVHDNSQLNFGYHGPKKISFLEDLLIDMDCAEIFSPSIAKDEAPAFTGDLITIYLRAMEFTKGATAIYDELILPNRCTNYHNFEDRNILKFLPDTFERIPEYKKCILHPEQFITPPQQNTFGFGLPPRNNLPSLENRLFLIRHCLFALKGHLTQEEITSLRGEHWTITVELANVGILTPKTDPFLLLAVVRQYFLDECENELFSPRIAASHYPLFFGLRILLRRGFPIFAQDKSGASLWKFAHEMLANSPQILAEIEQFAVREMILMARFDANSLFFAVIGQSNILRKILNTREFTFGTCQQIFAG
ncbi:MAG: hypothetical protein M0R33_19025 [Methylomonas sp.]|jgi:hypothetical protein|uniref:hypothetical protein n=1 Tax=Methylomonas sp. TaxID=418 RepID=UPI0025CFD9E5|nr:hypothetical protein [Methylomonas sp.]MCK9608539.1 hypothetical protein [Methylomonas sp.]